jgi:NADH-quinone oxidoreductase subunit E
MSYLRKVNIKGKGYYYLFHTVREDGKFKKLSKYIGKEEPSKEELEKLKEEFEMDMKGKRLSEVIDERSRENIIDILKDIQREHGCLPEKNIRELSKKTGIPVVEIYSTATFYSMLSAKKKGKKVIRVCNSPSCYLNGSFNVIEELKKIIGIGVDETNEKFSLELSSCIGCCDKAPAIMINDELIVNVTKEKLKEVIK